jgi:hypothetical protein
MEEEMLLFYDPRDREAARMGDRRLKWLYELGGPFGRGGEA